MGQVTVTTTINAPIAKVWELWTDIEKLPQWFPEARRVISHDGRLDRPGARYVLDLGSDHAECEVVAVEALSLHQHSFRQKRMRAVGSGTARFQAAGDTTQVDFDASYKLPLGPAGLLLDRLLIARIAEPRMRQEIAKFKKFVEGRSGPDSE